MAIEISEAMMLPAENPRFTTELETSSTNSPTRSGTRMMLTATAKINPSITRAKKRIHTLAGSPPGDSSSVPKPSGLVICSPFRSGWTLLTHPADGGEQVTPRRTTFDAASSRLHV